MSDFPTLSRAGTRTGMVALTIDDGPNPGTTEMLLDILAAYNAPAAFFACGINVERYPGLARRIVAAGHGLYSHGYDHPSFDTLDDAAITDQLERTETLLRRFRPTPNPLPVRLPNGAGVRDSRVRAAMARWNPNTVAVQWTLCAEEWCFQDREKTPLRIAQACDDGIAKLTDWDGAIILMHDWPGRGMFCATLLERYLLRIGQLGLGIQALFQ